MESVHVPVEAALVVATFNVDEPEPLTELGLNVAVTPPGAPLTVRFTIPAKQPFAPTPAV
jgi:hypothetical protein